MPYAVELFFNTECEAAIRRIWHDLADAGVESTMLDIRSRPHLTLAVFEEVQLDEMCGGLDHFGRDISPFPVFFSSVGFFPTERGIVFLAAGATPTLLETHAGFYRRFGDLGSGAWRIYLPGRWVPHSTLATDVADELVPKAVSVARRAALPIEGTVRELAVVSFRPVDYLYTCPLSAE